MARPDLLEVYDGWQILYPSALKGGEGKAWGGPRTTRFPELQEYKESLGEEMGSRWSIAGLQPLKQKWWQD